MGGEHPESIVLPSERLDRGPLGQVPHANCLVFTARDDQFMLGMEESARHVVEMTSARIDLPSFRLAHPPELDLPIIGGGYDQGKSGVEHGIVDSAVMTLKNILHSRESIESVESTGRRVRRALAQARYIPDTYSLIHRRRYDKVFFRVKKSGHHIVRVPGQDGDAVARSTVPYTDCLVVGRGYLR